MSEAKHAPLPWEAFPPDHPRQIKTVTGHPGCDQSELTPVIIMGGGRQMEANIEFIVRACNAHDDLLAACKRLVQMFSGHHDESTTERMILDIGRSAIAKADTP